MEVKRELIQYACTLEGSLLTNKRRETPVCGVPTFICALKNSKGVGQRFYFFMNYVFSSYFHEATRHKL